MSYKSTQKQEVEERKIVRKLLITLINCEIIPDDTKFLGFEDMGRLQVYINDITHNYYYNEITSMEQS